MSSDPELRPWLAVAAALPLAFAAGLIPSATAAQSITVPHAATCPRCTVVTEKLVTVGTTDEDMLAPNAAPVVDRRGRYFAEGWGRRTVLVWDSTGKLVGTFGRAGQGPGEFAQNIIGIWIAAGDSIVVADRSLRVTVFSPALEYARSFRLPAQPQSVALLPSGQMVIGAIISRPTPIPYRFHVVDGATGAIVRSFGATGAAAADARSTSFSPSTDGRFIWHRIGNEYRFERWDVAGGTSELFDVSDTPWYVPPPPPREMSREESMVIVNARVARNQAVIDSMDAANAAKAPPSSSMVVTGTDRQGRLWIFGNEAVKPAGSLAAELSRVGVKHFLEVIDPATRSKLLSIPFELRFVRIPGSDLVYSRNIDSDGGQTLTIWRVRIDGM